MSLLLTFSCHKLHDTTGFLDLALSIFAEVAGANDERDLRQATLAENFAVAEREEVEDGCGVGAGALCKVFLALLERDEGPQLQVVFVRDTPIVSRNDASVPCRG